MGPADPIIGLNEAFQKDTHPTKVIVGVGSYRDAGGKPYVLPCVREAERKVIEAYLDMEYSGIVRV
jgi:aspartate aminotransferase, mitochondrial